MTRICSRGLRGFFVAAAVFLSGSAAIAQIALTGSNTVGFFNQNNCTVQTPMPPGNADLLIVQVAVQFIPPFEAINAPAGWVQIGTKQANSTFSGGLISTAIFAKRHVPDVNPETATFTWTTANTSEFGTCGITSWSGVDTAGTVDSAITVSSNSGGSSTQPTALSVTTPTPNNMLVAFFSRAQPGFNTFTPPAGMNQIYFISEVWAGDELQAAAGPSGNRNAGLSPGNGWTAFLLALHAPCPTITITNPDVTTGTTGTAFSQTFTQTGATGATFTTSSTLPSGLSLATDGTLSGTPTQSGMFGITVTVTDAGGCTQTSSPYNLTISCPTITVTNPGVTTGTSGTAFSQTFTQTGGTGTATFTTASPLPNGLTLSSGGVLAGTPTQTGTFPIDVTATDANGCASSNGTTYSLVISCPTITVTNPGVTTGTSGTAFSQTFTQTGGTGTTTFTTASALPNGLTLSSGGVLAGTPTQTGTFPIDVTATDANGCVSGKGTTYNVVISCPTIDITNPSVTAATTGTSFSQTFTQSGGTGTVTFTTSSTLPTGLALASNGTLSGTPTQTGSFPIVVTATDANGCTGTSATYNLDVTCPAITVVNPSTATGALSSPFSQTFTQTGGAGTVTFATASALPAGLLLGTNGVLAGTPTATGTFPIIVTATDANGCVGTGTTYTLDIQATAAIPTLSDVGLLMLALCTAFAGILALKR